MIRDNSICIKFDLFGKIQISVNGGGNKKYGTSTREGATTTRH